MPAKKNKGIMESIGDVANNINKAISRPIRRYEAWQSKELDRSFDAAQARIARENQQEANKANQKKANKARGTQSSATRKLIK